MKSQFRNIIVPLLIAFWMISSFIYPDRVRAEAPVINVWYGQHQVFGRPTMSQHWFNILGNISNPDDLISLKYSLNDGPERPLSVGPDMLRLVGSGDFNIDIHYTELKPGYNEVAIIADSKDDQRAIETVTLEYIPYNAGSQVYNVDWNRTQGIHQVAQIVDGLWVLQADGIRPTAMGYDRLIAVGDRWWDDYEVTVPFTVHDVVLRTGSRAHGAVMSVGVRWQGHRLWDDSQPANGWWPLGGSGGIIWTSQSKTLVRLGGNKAHPMAIATESREIEFNVPYMLKVRVETIPGYTSLYSLKMWEADQPEPDAWTLQGQQRLWDPMFGSVLLVAHHTDVTFGNISITPIARSPWEWFVLLGSYAAQIPLLLICLIGIVLAMRYRTRHSTPARLVLAAAILAAIGALGGTFMNIQLPLWLHRHGWSTDEIALALVANETIQSMIAAISLGLLIWVVFRLRQEAAKYDVSQLADYHDDRL